MLPGQPHTAMDTAPELFVRELLAFLAEPKSPEGSERTRSQDKGHSENKRATGYAILQALLLLEVDQWN